VRYIVLDLRQIKDELGHHFDKAREGEYRGVCENCDENVPQAARRCPVCGIPVVWQRSKTWRSLYGPPAEMIKLLSIVDPWDGPSDRLCLLAKVQGFANEVQAQRWKDAVAVIGSLRALEIVNSAAESGGGKKIVNRAVNMAEIEAGKIKRGAKNA
jgi:hypothetical protein